MKSCGSSRAPWATAASSVRTAWARFSGRLLGMGVLALGGLHSFDAGLALDDAKHLVFHNHSNKHLAVLWVAVFGTHLGNVLARLSSQLFQALLDVGVGDVQAELSGNRRHEKARAHLLLGIGIYLAVNPAKDVLVQRVAVAPPG